MPKHTTAPINTFNAGDIDTQTTYPEFFDVIRNHIAYTLYFRFANSLRIPEEERDGKDYLKEYEKEKKKLMKALQIYKQYCKQPGSVIDKFMWREHMVRPRNPV
jgi:hypothetical protein